MYIQKGFISRQINRSNRNLLITSLGIMLVLLLITYILIMTIQNPLDSGGIATIFVLLALVTPCFIIVLWILQRFIHRHINPQEHPILKQLRSYGDTETAVSQIEAEINQSFQKIGRVFLTSNWLISKSPYTLDIVQIQDIVWFYRLTTHYRSRYHRSYDVNKYEVMVCDRQERTVSLPVRKAQIDDLVNALYLKVPSWTITGYDDELKRMWQEQRSKMIASVDERRRIVQQSNHNR